MDADELKRDRETCERLSTASVETCSQSDINLACERWPAALDEIDRLRAALAACEKERDGLAFALRQPCSDDGTDCTAVAFMERERDAALSEAARLLAGIHLLRNLSYAGSTSEYIAQVGQWVIDGHHGEDEDPPKDELRSSDTPAAPSRARNRGDDALGVPDCLVEADERRYDTTTIDVRWTPTPAAPSPAPSSEYRRGYERAVEAAAEAALTVNCPGPHGEGYCVALPSVMDALRSLLPTPEREGTEEEDPSGRDDPACDAAYAQHCAEEEDVERLTAVAREAYCRDSLPAEARLVLAVRAVLKARKP